ncbi:MAG: PAS domain-containing protein [Nitrospirae bacterium]|nr:PAS domain-containing protein [Nitrospirota bacterium]
MEQLRIEEQLRHRIVIETMLSDISRLFMSSPDIDLNNVLRIIGECVTANRAYIFEFSKDGRLMSNTYEWCDNKTTPQIGGLQEVDVSIAPWWMAKLKGGENIIIPDIDALPAEASSEKEVLKAQDIHSLVVVPIWSKDGTLTGFMGFDDCENVRSWSEEDVKVLRVVSDIISYHFTHKKAEDALRQSEARLSRAQKIAHLGNWERDIIKDKVTWSDEVYNILGMTSGKFGRTYDLYLDFVHPDDIASVKKSLDDALYAGKPYNIEYRILLPDGSEKVVSSNCEVIFDNNGNPAKLFGTILDITERRRLEEQLMHSQKMEAIGRLAGGIAHDFNNIMTAIIGNADLMQLKLDEGNPLMVFVENIISSSERAVSLTQSLLAFSRKQITSLKPVNVNEIVKKVDKLLLRLIGEDIELHTHESVSEGMVVNADSVQLEQVLINLATNARDAMPKGGLLKISTGMAELDEQFVKAFGYGNPGRYAVICVEDSGMGMDNKTMKKIFDPFFTTKEVGKGTGLGLSIVYGIVKQHKGYVEVSSEPDIGTRFNVYLPLINKEVETPVKKTPVEPEGGNETILIAEDDNDVRGLLKDMLEGFGYKVIEAADGEKAIRLFEQNRKNIHLVILDVIMPGKNGKEAFEKIREIRPDIKTIFMSGYTSNIIDEKGIFKEGLTFIQKPIMANVLLKKVREVLDVNTP